MRGVVGRVASHRHSADILAPLFAGVSPFPSVASFFFYLLPSSCIIPPAPLPSPSPTPFSFPYPHFLSPSPSNLSKKTTKKEGLNQILFSPICCFLFLVKIFFLSLSFLSSLFRLFFFDKNLFLVLLFCLSFLSFFSVFLFCLSFLSCDVLPFFSVVVLKKWQTNRLVLFFLAGVLVWFDASVPLNLKLS